MHKLLHECLSKWQEVDESFETRRKHLWSELKARSVRWSAPSLMLPASLSAVREHTIHLVNHCSAHQVVVASEQSSQAWAGLSKA